MTLVSWAKKGLARPASIESPLVQEIVLAADLRCPKCQKRVTDVMSTIDDMESLVVDVQDKKVSLIRRREGKTDRKMTASPEMEIIYD